MEQRIAVGAMTGTSIDGLDVAAARISGRGSGLKATFIAHRHAGLGDLAADLRRAADQVPLSAGRFAELALALGQLTADLIVDLAKTAGLARLDLVAVHGQTVVHRPPVSWQLVNPASIAATVGCPVVSDLRQADLARGGQGAPITPAADCVLYGADGRARAIVNLGGFCNVTILGPGSGDVQGFDVCACNQVLDAVARRALGAAFDAEGRCALRGAADHRASDALRCVLEAQRTAARSLGTGDEARRWADDHAGLLRPDDLARTAVEAVAASLATAIEPHHVEEVVLAGGGARNRALREALQVRLAAPVVTSDAHGIPIDAREALGMAVLGALCADGVSITPRGPRRDPFVSGTWTGVGGSAFSPSWPAGSAGH